MWGKNVVVVCVCVSVSFMCSFNDNVSFICVSVVVGVGVGGLTCVCFFCRYFRCMKCFLGLVCGMNAGACEFSVMSGVVCVGEGVGSMCNGTGSAQSELALVLCVGVVWCVECVVDGDGVGSMQDGTGSAQIELALVCLRVALLGGVRLRQKTALLCWGRKSVLLSL